MEKELEEKSLKDENNFLKEMIRTYYQPEIALLQQKIDKAIEYINTTDRWLCRVNDNLCVETIGKDKLLEILGDKENEDIKR